MARAEDDGARGSRGLCISVRPHAGKLELTLDSVSLNGTNSRTWRHDTFITFADLDVKEAKEFSFSEERLAEFGRLVLGALLPGAA